MSAFSSQMGLRGRLRVKRITKAQRERQIRWSIFKWKVRNFFVQRWREMPLEVVLFFVALAQYFVAGLNMPLHSRLYLKVVKANGEVWDYGMVGCHTITTVGKTYVRDAWINTVELETMKFHGIGTGTNAPAVGDTALQTELTTQYNPDSTRATGSLTNNGSNVFRTVGTNTVDATAAITEWGLLTQAATGGGTLFDRQTFTVLNLVSGDSLQTTYDVTIG